MDINEYRRHYKLERTNWWFVSRRQIVNSFLSGLNEKGKVKILDIGCGTGANLKFFEKFGKVFGIDPSKEALKYAKTIGCKGVKIGRAEKIPYKSDSFDAVLLLDVLEHTDNEREALKEIKRVSKKSSLLIMTVPAFMSLWGSPDEFLWHRRRYTKSELVKLAESAGFKVVKCSYFFFIFAIPLYFARRIEKLKYALVGGEKKLGATLSLQPGVFNSILLAYMGLENLLLKYINLPIGTSILCICKKIRRP